jgi:hypothetical protein
MGLLDDSLAFIDSRKRFVGNTINDISADPAQGLGLLGRRALDAIAEGARNQLNAADKMGSVIPSEQRAGLDQMLPGLLGAGGLGTIKQVGGTWYKGMWPHDYTKETPTNPGPLIDPANINRSTPFPTFNGDGSTIDGIRGFFSNDPAVASRFADKSGAVFPVKIAADDAKILTIDANGAKAGDIQFGKTGKKFQDAVRSGKYETILIKNTKDEGDIAVALRGSDISSTFK